MKPLGIMLLMMMMALHTSGVQALMVQEQASFKCLELSDQLETLPWGGEAYRLELNYCDPANGRQQFTPWSVQGSEIIFFQGDHCIDALGAVDNGDLFFANARSDCERHYQYTIILENGSFNATRLIIGTDEDGVPYCLDRGNNYGRVHAWTCHSGANQIWTIAEQLHTPDEYRLKGTRFVNKSDGHCLTFVDGDGWDRSGHPPGRALLRPCRKDHLPTDSRQVWIQSREPAEGAPVEFRLPSRGNYCLYRGFSLDAAASGTWLDLQDCGQSRASWIYNAEFQSFLLPDTDSPWCLTWDWDFNPPDRVDAEACEGAVNQQWYWEYHDVVLFQNTIQQIAITPMALPQFFTIRNVANGKCLGGALGNLQHGYEAELQPCQNWRSQVWSAKTFTINGEQRTWLELPGVFAPRTCLHHLQNVAGLHGAVLGQCREKFDMLDPMATYDTNWIFNEKGQNRGQIVYANGRDCLWGDISATSRHTCEENTRNEWLFEPVNLATVSGIQTNLQSMGSDKCMDDTGQTGNGIQVHAWTCNGNNLNQRWNFVPTTDGFFNIVNQRSGQCLDVSNANPANGTAIQQWRCDGVPAQEFRSLTKFNGLQSTPVFSIQSRATSKCVDLAGGGQDNGTKFQTWTCNLDHPNMQFLMVN